MKTENNGNYFHDLNELKAFERVDGNVSKKYVPIYTSAVIEAMAPEFTLDYGHRVFKTWSAHYAMLNNEAGDTIKITNSFDRRWAFGFQLITKEGFTVRVGLDRIVHIGAKAKEFNETFKDQKEDILKAIKNAATFATTLQNTKVQPALQEKITDIVFRKSIGTKGFQSLTNDADVLQENSKNGMSVTGYILATLKAFEKGNYTVTNQGTKKVGGKTKSIFNRTQTESLLMDLIEDEFEYYLL